MLLSAVMLTGCGLLKKKETLKLESSKTEQGYHHIKSVNESLNEETDVEHNINEVTQTDVKETLQTVKGELEVVRGVNIEDGLNVVETDHGGKLFIVSNKDGKLDFIVSKPEYNIRDTETKTLNDLKSILVESVKSSSDNNNSEEGSGYKNSSSDKKVQKKSKINIGAVIVLLFGIFLLVYTVYKKVKSKLKI